MKLLFFSDLHGVAEAFSMLLERERELEPDRLVMLGDVLFHDSSAEGSSLCDAPATADMLNECADRIIAVKGNCDSYNDQMLINFPILADYFEISAENRRFFVTHGHRWNRYNLPEMIVGTVLVQGHTHIPDIFISDGVEIFNPGSISFPKAGFPRSFGFFDGESLSIRRLDNGSVLMTEQQIYCD